MTVRYRIHLRDLASNQLRVMAPVPKREIREVLRQMAEYPYGEGSKELEWSDEMHRFRVGDYRIVFEPVKGERAINVTRIGHRSTVYEGIERPSRGDSR